MLEKRSIWRAIFSALVSGMGGVSLTASILPFVITKLFGEINFAALTGIMNSTVLIALLWAAGGGIVGWLGGTRTGGLIIGMCGALTGLLLGVFAAKGDLPLVTVAVVVGLLYGAPGGLIMGRVFPAPMNQT